MTLAEARDTKSTSLMRSSKNLGRRGHLGILVDQLEGEQNFRKDPTFLRSELKRYIDENNLQTGSWRVRPGQSLQRISYRLYGTHFRWPELYVLNKDKIKNWDVVQAHSRLRYIK